MNKSDVMKLFKTAQKVVSDNSPKILTGVGIGCMIGGAIMAVKATPKAMELIEEEKENRKQNPNDEVELTKVEMVKAAWKPYVPATLSILVGAGCIVGANTVNARRQAVLYSALKLSETTLTELKEKTREVVGPEKVKEIKQKIAEDKVEKVTEPDSKVKVVLSTDGDTWFIDKWSNIRFRSSANKIEAACNAVSRRLMTEMSLSLDELYDELGIDTEDRSDTAKNIGWHIDTGLIEPDFHNAIVKDGAAYIVLEFTQPPVYDYDNKDRLYGAY